MAKINIEEDRTIWTQDILKVRHSCSDSSIYKTLIETRFNEKIYVKAKVHEVERLVREAEEEERGAGFELLAKKISENLFDMLQTHEKEKAGQQLTKIKFPLKIG